MLYKTKSIILRNRNLGEADRIVTAFTEEYGKINGVAKGSRKIKSRFCGNLEPFYYCDLLYFGKKNQNLYYINSCDIRRSLPGIREDLKRLSTSLCAVELVDSMCKESIVNREIFRLLANTLFAIESCADLNAILRLFEMRLMSLLGYAPELQICAYCNRSSENSGTAFSYIKNGIVCAGCLRREKNAMPVNQGTIKFLNKSMHIHLDKIDRLKIPKGLEKEIGSLTQRYIRSHTDRKLKSYQFMTHIMND